MGTTRGVVTCWTVNRLAIGERWNKNLVLGMMGVPWETIFGRKSMHIPVETSEDGREVSIEEGNNEIFEVDEADEEISMRFRGGPDKLHISQKAVRNSGTTPGCPACRELERRGHASGRLGYNNSETCRRRIFNRMVQEPEYKTLVDRHGNMKTDGVANVATVEQQRTQSKWIKHTMIVLQHKMKSEGENLGYMLNNVMLGMLRQEMDVVEVYSPPRVAAMAKQLGFRAGWCLDLTTCDERGVAWDFNRLEMRNKAAWKLIQDKPRLLIGSFICTTFSTMNNVNYTRMSKEEVKQRMDYGRRHLEFCAGLYDIQWREGRYFLHGHPQAASSWQEDCIRTLMAKKGECRGLSAINACMGSDLGMDNNGARLERGPAL